MIKLVKHRWGEIMKSCIYCGASDDLSKSDIVPDALTNAKIINNCVCRVEHNNKFSDEFESKVIEALSFITNELDIKSSKSNQFSKYDAIFSIDGTDYIGSTRGNFDLFNGRVLKTDDEKTGLASLEKAYAIAKDKEKVTPINVNEVMIEKKVNIDLSIFFDTAMYRLISKIAFEWYCLKNNISEPKNEFKQIVKFIVSGVGENPVTLIQNKKLYDSFGREQNIGSHTLLAFVDNQCKVNVAVYLFGIAMYRVVLCNSIPTNCTKNLIYQELRTDAQKKEIVSANIVTLSTDISEFFCSKINFQCANEINGMKIMVAKNVPTLDLTLSIFVVDAANVLSQLKDDTIVPNDTINKILISRINDILQSSLLHKKSIKRFVNDNLKNRTEPIKINEKATDKKTFFFLYMLMKIGEKDITSMNDNLLQQLAKEIFEVSAGNEVKITDELEEHIKRNILETDNYSDLIQKGADIVQKWI